ncbi:MAG TPA: HlyD family secretion protein [Dongiaceae bacterium]|nr:HlyD family secretion protein [Dongiaceae bacterium]
MIEAIESPTPRPAGRTLNRQTTKLILKRGVSALLLLGALVAAGYYGERYWTIGQYQQSTDDAYVKADFTVVAPKVAGYIAEVLVQDNQQVKAGQLLARIDDRDFRTALDQARADVTATEAAIHHLDAEVSLQQSVIDQEKANITAAEAALKFAQADRDRYQDLVKTGSGTLQRAQQTEAALGEKTAELQGSRAGLVAAQKQIDVLAAERANAVAQHDHNLAVAHQAELNLSYTTITAPVDGTVGARSLRVGQYVQAGSQLMAVVPLHAVYVVANFKETQLTYVRSGQPVAVEVDSFPGVKLSGHVDSLAPASGLEFSLLPPDNATGNFTKIVQRIPVKIVFDNDALAGLLRSGMSVTPTIDTKQATLEAERQDETHNLVADLTATAKKGS